VDHGKWWWISDLGRHRGNAFKPDRSANGSRREGSSIWNFTKRNFGNGSHHHRLALERLTHAHRSGIGRSRRNLPSTRGNKASRIFGLAHVSIRQPSNPFQFERNGVSKFNANHWNDQRTLGRSKRKGNGSQRNIAYRFKRGNNACNFYAGRDYYDKRLPKLDRLDYV